MAGEILVPHLGFVELGVEASYGTEQATRTSVPLTSEPTVTPVNQNVERSRVKPTQGGVPHGIIPQKCTYSFQCAVQPLEFSDGAAPAVGPILIGAGMSETLSGATTSNDVKAVYDFQSVGHDSVTLKFFIREKDTGKFTSILVLGGRHNITYTLGDNAEVLMDVNGEGLYAEWTTIATETVTDPNSETPFVTYNEVLTHHGKTLDVANFNVATGWNIQNRMDHTGAVRYVKEVFLARGTSGARPSGQYDAVALADYLDSDDWRDKVRAAESTALQHTITSPDGNAVITVDAPAVQCNDFSLSDAGEYYNISAPFSCNESAGNDDLKFTFDRTAA